MNGTAESKYPPACQSLPKWQAVQRFVNLELAGVRDVALPRQSRPRDQASQYLAKSS